MGYFEESKKAKQAKLKPTAKRCFIWCSKCHTNPRLAPFNPNFDKSAFDRWCPECYAKTPLIERSRKCSRGELKKLIKRKQESADRLAEERAEILRLKLEKAEREKANRKANPVKPKKRKKSISEAFSLAFDEDFLSDYWSDDDETTGQRLETDYDRMRRRIAKINDPTIYQDAAELVRDN